MWLSGGIISEGQKILMKIEEINKLSHFAVYLKLTQHC